jgi:hypothetical protein
MSIRTVLNLLSNLRNASRLAMRGGFCCHHCEYREDGCNKQSTCSEGYCDEHQNLTQPAFELEECNRLAMRGEFCRHHCECREDGCNKQSTCLDGYCDEHKSCAHPGCKNFRRRGRKWCMSHNLTSIQNGKNSMFY